MWYKNHSSVYEGEFLNDAPHGVGNYTWRDGDYYVGVWVAGRREGQGLLHKTDGTVIQQEWNVGDDAASHPFMGMEPSKEKP